MRRNPTLRDVENPDRAQVARRMRARKLGVDYNNLKNAGTPYRRRYNHHRKLSILGMELEIFSFVWYKLFLYVFVYFLLGISFNY